MRYTLFILLCLFFIKPLSAAPWGTDCTYQTKTVNVALPGGIKISIDPDAPVGTVFFEFYVPAQSGLSFTCQTTQNYTKQHGYIYGNGETVSMTGGGVRSQTGSAYTVYKTNVPGIGIMARFSVFALPYWVDSASVAKDYADYMAINFDLNIVKYGPVPAGVSTLTIDSSVISSIDWVTRISNSSNGSAIPNGNVLQYRFVFTPVTMRILTATCDTPDVSVNLGSHKLFATDNRESGKFATPWVDASIRLVNCPVFYGTGERVKTKNTTRNNLLNVSLLPGNSRTATNSSQGIMLLDTGEGAAKGVGIQLAYGDASAPELVDFTSGYARKTYTMSPSQGATYTLPLVARYMQTADAVSEITPGRANGKITYLINYY